MSSKHDHIAHSHPLLHPLKHCWHALLWSFPTLEESPTRHLQQDVISRSGLPILCVLMLPNATPGLASLFKPHLTTLGEISPFPSHLEHQLSTNAKCLGVGSDCKGLYGNWLLSWPNIFSSYSCSSINTNREPLSCIRITTLEFLSSLSAACSF